MLKADFATDTLLVSMSPRRNNFVKITIDSISKTILLLLQLNGLLAIITSNTEKNATFKGYLF
jgi:hypothetical protein